MLNRAMEIHDSVLQRITRTATGVIVEISAYVHESNGEPGVDEGTGWIQPTALQASNADFEGRIPEMPCDLRDGYIVLTDRRLENVIPMPLEDSGRVEIKLEAGTGDFLLIRGDSVRLVVLDEAEYVERFRPKP